MKNKIAIIIPYFGKFPSYFNLWFDSANHNKEFDFFIYTDSNDDRLLRDSSNIFIKKITFEDFADKIRNLFEFEISLDSPYKLCDYRPTYGLVLSKDIKGYDFWGHCDIDLIFGDMSHFITDKILDKNDRIYNLGHLTLYRNAKNMNELFMISHKFSDCFSYRYCYRFPFAMAFDEIGTKYGYGISTICKRIGVMNYISMDFADVLPDKYEFELAYTDRKNIEYFVYEKGKIFGIWRGKKVEYLYVHLQKRNMECDEIKENEYFISPTHFRKDKLTAINDLYSSKERRKFHSRVIKRKIISKLKKIKQGAIFHYFNRRLGRINI